MTTTEVQPAESSSPRRFRRITTRVAKVAGTAIAALVVAGTAASFGYNLASDGPAPRPAHLLFARGGGWDTRYLDWGTRGTPVVLIDEPTAELDVRNEATVLRAFARLRDEFSGTVIVVTHSPRVAEAAARVVEIRDGRAV